MKFTTWFLGFITQARMQQQMQSAMYSQNTGSKYGRTRIKGKPGQSGDKLARMAKEGRIGMRHYSGAH